MKVPTAVITAARLMVSLGGRRRAGLFLVQREQLGGNAGRTDRMRRSGRCHGTDPRPGRVRVGPGGTAAHPGPPVHCLADVPAPQPARDRLPADLQRSRPGSASAHPPAATGPESAVQSARQLPLASPWCKGQPVGFGACGGAGPKDHAVSRCLTGADGGIRFSFGVRPPTCIVAT